MADDVGAGLAGAAFDLANAGYAPMPDPRNEPEQQEIGSDGPSLRQAAEQLPSESDGVVARGYLDANGEPAPQNEAVTLVRAARDYADVTAAERLVAENENSKSLADRVDALRARAAANDPDAADFYGFELPEVEEATGKSENEAGESESSVEAGADPSSPKLDPEIVKALQHPQVLQAIEEQIGEVEKARQGYRDGLLAATQLAQASFLSQFPELAAIAPENLPGALEMLSRQDPARFARVKSLIVSSEQLLARQEQENRLQAELARRNFQRFAQREDTRLEGMLKDEPTATQRAVVTEIMASASASGIEPAELNRLFNTEPLMRNATFQRMMYDAGKYRLMMKAKDAAVARKVPPVQRPGTAVTRSERERGDLRTLSSRLSASGDIKDAVALYRARTSGKQ
jgi:hypothetical protein